MKPKPTPEHQRANQRLLLLGKLQRSYTVMRRQNFNSLRGIGHAFKISRLTARIARLDAEKLSGSGVTSVGMPPTNPRIKLRVDTNEKE